MSLTVLDLSAAFDTVDHSILTSTLKTKFGINELALKWFDSYLQPRSIKVAVNGKYSDEKQLTYSVPQGSCSGAYLFNLYCSTLNDIVPSDLHLSGFADDHSVRKEFRANDRNAELQTKEEIEDCMVNIRSWMDWVRLKMNSPKTEFITWLAAELTFKEHTTKKCQTAIINYLCIRNICHLLTDSACETLLF